MGGGNFFFAGGGTGGHIYPGLSVAERIVEHDDTAKIHFVCSQRRIDLDILGTSGFEMIPLAAKGLSLRPGKLIEFGISQIASYRRAKEIFSGLSNAVVVGIGGFVAAPVCLAASKLGLPVVLINVDIVPGRANRMIGRFADEIFVQFDKTIKEFKKVRGKISVVGCPLRLGFSEPRPDRAIEKLGLDREKKILLVTGASSGAQNINRAVCSLLDTISSYADDWQIVHLTGTVNLAWVEDKYAGVKISHKVVGYFDEMADLLGAADLVIGRSGAVSVAEYAAAGVASICMPYPHHKDRHQYFNAEVLVNAGAAVVVDDLPDEKERAELLWEQLEELLKDDAKRIEMSDNCKTVSRVDAASEIADNILSRIS